jgi:hypothetical protein
MVKYFGKYSIALVSILLVGGLTFLIVHRTAGAPSSVRGNKDNLLTPSPVKEIEGYKQWTKVNSVPQLMPERVAADCYLWKAPGGEVVNGPDNPHRDTYFTVYVNDFGREAMLKRKNPVFPEGTVIVKEKLSTKDSQEPELLTVMIKQNQGFDPASGNWEYMVVDGTGTKVEGRGHLQNCQSCHLAHQKNDYIFRTYLPAKVSSKLK